MKLRNLAAMALSLAIAFPMSYAPALAEDGVKTYQCVFSAEETKQYNRYSAGVLNAMMFRTDIRQVNTLTLDEGTYQYTKSLTSEADPVDPGVRILYTFAGTFEREGNACLLKTPTDGQYDVNVGDFAGTYGKRMETGSGTMSDNPGMAWMFSEAFFDAMSTRREQWVTLNEDGTLSYDRLTSQAEATADGNAEEYGVAQTEPLSDQPLNGKTIYWLGSSVTEGSASGGETMADFLAKRQGAVCVKEAVSGTTLFGDLPDSCVMRLQSSPALDRNAHVDAVVIQISTNDAANAINTARLGRLTADDKRAPEDFDTTTTLGAAEFMVAYIQETWHCPVLFYSGSFFGCEHGYHYSRMIDAFRPLCEKWGVEMLDLFGDERFNAISPQDYANYTADPIHPNRLGYRDWWTPAFEAKLAEMIQ